MARLDPYNTNYINFFTAAFTLAHLALAAAEILAFAAADIFLLAFFTLGSFTVDLDSQASHSFFEKKLG